MVTTEEIPVERANDFWKIQFGYLVDDGMVVTDEEKRISQVMNIAAIWRG